jgi:hypothetical protein
VVASAALAVTASALRRFPPPNDVAEAASAVSRVLEVRGKVAFRISMVTLRVAISRPVLRVLLLSSRMSWADSPAVFRTE